MTRPRRTARPLARVSLVARHPSIIWCRVVTTSVVLILAASHAAAQLAAPPTAPPLAPPEGNVVFVSTVGELHNAVAALSSNTTIMIRPGVYRLQGELRLRNNVTNVVLRGSTGRRDDVVILGSGMYTDGVNIAIKCENATDVLIADLSVGEAKWHPIQLKGESGCDRVRMYNLRLFDSGSQFVKGTVDFANPNGVDNGVVEYSVIEYTTIGPNHGYTQGIDVHHGANWVIRNNLFRNIRVPLDAPIRLGPAVLMWSGSRGTVTEQNTFIDCERAIMYGLGPQDGFLHSHEGGLIANNFVYRSAAVAGDSGISVWDSPATKVLNNTVLNRGTYPDAIEYRFPGSFGVEVYNNLTDATIRQRDGAQAMLGANITTATPSMFVDAASGNLHLRDSATAAIDTGIVLPVVSTDWDGRIRPSGATWDVGADEYDGIGILCLDAAPASQTLFVDQWGAVTLTLDSAQTNDVSVSLQSSDPGVAWVPEIATFVAASTMTTFDVYGSAPGGPVEITAALPEALGGSTATVSVAVRQPAFRLTVRKSGSGTVRSVPSGINCGATCSALFEEGTAVTLTATPARRYVFAGWIGHADCADGVVTMDAEKTCRAVFKRR